MIKDLMDELYETGSVPKVSKLEDPFWDPPNPILIGQAFL
jgi:hypothetical protein